jgi:CO dehydrogenase maturation factor
MKLAIAGKGGVGKTSVSAWLGDYLSRAGQEVWLIDADTALSLGPALGLTEDEVPRPLIEERELINERVGEGFINLNPMVADLPERLSKKVGKMKLLVMGSIAAAGAGCACSANSLLKALMAHLVIGKKQWVIIDLEAGVEHLGRGTVQSVDGLVIVSEPSLRSLQTASRVSRLAQGLGLARQALVLNRADGKETILPEGLELPPLVASIPPWPSLTHRQLGDSSVVNLTERNRIDEYMGAIITYFANNG